MSKVFGRLVDRKLIERSRSGRASLLTLLREDGSGAEYTHPGTAHDGYLKLPHEFWTSGDYQKLSVQGVAMLLVALSHKGEFYLPLRKVKEWYGFGHDSAIAGFTELRNLGVLSDRDDFRVNNRMPTGWEQQRYYHLTDRYARRRKVKAKPVGAVALEDLLAGLRAEHEAQAGGSR